MAPSPGSQASPAAPGGDPAADDPAGTGAGTDAADAGGGSGVESCACTYCRPGTRQVPLVVRVLLLVLGTVATLLIALTAFAVFHGALSWNGWAGSWAAIAVTVVLGTVCLLPFGYAHQRGIRSRYPAPLVVRVLAVVSAAVLPLPVTVTAGVWLHHVAGWPDLPIVLVVSPALVGLAGTGIIVAGGLCAPVEPGPATGHRPGDPLLAEDVSGATGRPVVRLVREDEHEGSGRSPDASQREGNWNLRFELAGGQVVNCMVDSTGGDPEYTDFLREVTNTGDAEAVPGLGIEAYAIAHDAVWALTGTHWSIYITGSTSGSHRHRRDTLVHLARAAIDRLPRTGQMR